MIKIKKFEVIKIIEDLSEEAFEGVVDAYVTIIDLFDSAPEGHSIDTVQIFNSINKEYLDIDKGTSGLEYLNGRLQSLENMHFDNADYEQGIGLGIIIAQDVLTDWQDDPELRYVKPTNILESSLRQLQSYRGGV